MTANHGNAPGSRTSPRPQVWIIDSDFTGELNARIGVAERLGFDYRVVPRPAGGAAHYARELARLGNTRLKPGNPAPVILLSGTGEDTVDQIADLRTVIGERALSVYLASILPDELNPRLQEYDLVASPQLAGTNVITTLGVAHRMTRESLRRASAEHDAIFTALPRPLLGLLLGGNTWYCSGFDTLHATGLAQRVVKLAGALDGYVAVSNSRRTPAAAMEAVLEQLGERCCYTCDWRRSPRGIYAALLEHSDLLVVSGDSLSMCSEATSTGKPVLIDLPEQATELQHREIVGRLIACGAARVLGGRYEPWTYVPPDPTGQVAAAIHSRLLARSVLPHCHQAR